MTVDFESATQKARAHAERGTELFFEEKYQDAAGELLLAIKASPEPFIEAERLLAHAYRLSIETPEQLARTIGQFEKVVSLDSSDVGSWCWLALLAQAASLTQQQIADATRQGWIQSGSTGTVSAIRQISRDSRIRKQANKFQQIASRASVQAWQGFAGLDPEQAAGDEILYALESAVTLADFYREEAGAPSTARDWYEMVSRVQVDALRDLSEEEIAQARELQATAERRHALLAEELEQAAERAKRKNTTTLIVIAVVVGLFLLTCFICSSGFGLFR